MFYIHVLDKHSYTPAKIRSSSSNSSTLERFEFQGQSEHGTMSPRKSTLPSDPNVLLKCVVALSCVN